jgi:hypothetical protein
MMQSAQQVQCWAGLQVLLVALQALLPTLRVQLQMQLVALHWAPPATL